MEPSKIEKRMMIIKANNIKYVLLLLICFFIILMIICTKSARSETDPERFIFLKTLTEHSDTVMSVALSPNNQWFFHLPEKPSIFHRY